MALSGCEKSKDIAQPSATGLSTAQTQDARKDDDYKRNKTGQYVSKDVQVPDYGGKERPTRPKYDIRSSSDLSTASSPPDDLKIEDPDEPCDGCGGGEYIPPFFVTSEGLGEISTNPSGFIYALRLVSGSSSNLEPSEGHIKIDVDLNKGAGGKFIYLTFTRDPQFSYENDGAHAPFTYNTPLTHLKVVSYSQITYINPFERVAPGPYHRHIYKFTFGNSIPVDLNDGAGGKYIFGHVSREALFGNPIKEVGVLYGRNSYIQPPIGWTRVEGDLNENAGGYFIYFCYKI